MISPVVLRQPRACQPVAHLVRTLIQNSESEWISQPSFPAYLIAAIMALPSMRILVVSLALPSATGLPEPSTSCSITAKPPGPGLGFALPSVQRIFIVLLSDNDG